MNCRDCQQLLPLHVGGDLLADQVPGLDLHLADCSDCHGAMQDLRRSFLALRDAAPTPPVGGLYAQIAPRLDAVDATERFRSAPWRRFAPWAAAAALLVASFVWLPKLDLNPGRPADPSSLESVASATVDPGQLQEGLRAVTDQELRDFLSRNAGLLHHPSQVELRSLEGLPAQARFREEF